MAEVVSPSPVPLTITVCYSPAARIVHTLVVVLPGGACVRDALAKCAMTDTRFTSALADSANVLHCTVWGAKVPPGHALHNHDRLELCRHLRVDPKVARRERFAKQGARTSGLFAMRRPGGKAGY